MTQSTIGQGPGAEETVTMFPAYQHVMTDTATIATLFARSRADAPTITLPTLGVTVRTLVATPESGGALCVLDYVAPPRFRGPAPHVHRTATECFIVLEGTLRLTVGEAVHDLEPGGAAHVPPGTVHAFSNPFDAPCRYLALLTPGMGFERYFEELAVLVAASPTWPPADPSAVVELARRYDTFPPGTD